MRQRNTAPSVGPFKASHRGRGIWGLLAIACTLATLLAVLPASAADVQVTVQDEAGKPLDGAVAFLESAAARAAVKPLAGAEIGQSNKRFTPSVLVVTVGTAVNFPNRDTVRHHVYSFAPAKTFDLKLYSGTPAAPVIFDKPGVVDLGCNIHDQMRAWVVVVDTPYFGRGEAAQAVALHGVPSGNYRLKVWHPRVPANAALWEQNVTVGAAPLALSVTLKGLDP